MLSVQSFVPVHGQVDHLSSGVEIGCDQLFIDFMDAFDRSIDFLLVQFVEQSHLDGVIHGHFVTVQELQSQRCRL